MTLAGRWPCVASLATPPPSPASRRKCPTSLRCGRKMRSAIRRPPRCPPPSGRCPRTTGSPCRKRWKWHGACWTGRWVLFVVGVGFYIFIPVVTLVTYSGQRDDAMWHTHVSRLRRQEMREILHWYRKKKLQKLKNIYVQEITKENSFVIFWFQITIFRSMFLFTHRIASKRDYKLKLMFPCVIFPAALSFGMKGQNPCVSSWWTCLTCCDLLVDLH